MPLKIFLSYRVDDEAGHAQLIFELLQERLPNGWVYKDDAPQRLRLGENIQAVLEAHIAACDVVLAVIGRSWLAQLAARASSEKDWVAWELETAFALNKRVVPVLVNTAPLTRAALPERLRQLADVKAAQVDPRQRHRDFAALFERLQELAPAPDEPAREAMAEGTWAVATGTDAFGSWADIEIAEVRTRLRYIPPGSFSMGSSPAEKGRWADEGPRHDVTLSRGYYLGEVPCTQALWSAVMGTRPSRFAGAQRPVEEVSWQDCMSFCAAINGHIRGLGARLPTEAEWEYACRAGSQASHYGSGALDPIAWWHANSEGQTRPVRQKAPNAWGLHDMLGNVWEWCSDWYGPYSAQPALDPLGANSGSRRVARGGAWCNRELDLRAALRNYWHDSGQLGCMGFRVARTARSAPIT